MPGADIVVESRIIRSARVIQLEGLFDIAPSQVSSERWVVDIPIENHDWNIGLIVGPSGSGKTSILRNLFADFLKTFEWESKRAIVDCFPIHMSIKDITVALSSVGFTSPPSWLRSYDVLSMGEQFRATVARGFCESDGLMILDEFTSVVDRTVAQIGSAAVAKFIRKNNRQFIAASCHYDIIEWLQPDWIYDTATQSFTWRSLRPRPRITLRICQVERFLWQIFRRYHYLSGNLHKAAKCYAAFIDDVPVAFASVLSYPHPRRAGWREHRTVCRPDYQGIGIGNALSDYVASLFVATGKPYFSTTGNPAMIESRRKSPNWRMVRPIGISSRQSPSSSESHMNVAWDRFTAGFEYIGPARYV